MIWQFIIQIAMTNASYKYCRESIVADKKKYHNEVVGQRYTGSNPFHGESTWNPEEYAKEIQECKDSGWWGRHPFIHYRRDLVTNELVVYESHKHK